MLTRRHAGMPFALTSSHANTSRTLTEFAVKARAVFQLLSAVNVCSRCECISLPHVGGMAYLRRRRTNLCGMTPTRTTVYVLSWPGREKMHVHIENSTEAENNRALSLPAHKSKFSSVYVCPNPARVPQMQSFVSEITAQNAQFPVLECLVMFCIMCSFTYPQLW